jgi:hypothetical protein
MQVTGIVSVGWWETIKSFFSSWAAAVPADVPHLTATSEMALSASLRGLLDGERGCITFSEARHLFSPMDDQYAFGEMDETGRFNLAEFAAQAEHRATFQIMPVEGRIYFTRKRG